MAHSSTHAESDRNLLFGVLAVQLNYISGDDLVAGMNRWASVRDKSLGQIMLEQGRLSAEQVQSLEALITERLKGPATDAEQSSDSRHAKLTEASHQTPPQESTRSTVAHDSAEPAPARFTAPTSAGADGTRFRRLRPHAAGGLGEVSVALDTELHREVALKEIKPKLADDRLCRSRFIREAEITGGLEHPGVVPVYALGAYPSGRLYYAMRFIRGDSMRTAIEAFHAADQAARDASERSLAFRQLLRRFVDVCNAVAYAHSRGVLHRDLKPANIMLGKFGETLVVDWGLAKAGWLTDDTPAAATSTPEPPLQTSASSVEQETRAGAAIGTLSFMSPEQAAGRLDLLSPASDVYSLGATLYVLLTGQRPYRDVADSDLLAQVQKGGCPPPRALKSGTPPALDAICCKAMAHAPQDRYAGALEFAADVEHWLADEPVSAFTDPWTVRLGRLARRHRTKLVATAVLLVSAVVALSASTALVWAEQQKTARQKDLAEKNYELSRDQSFNIIELIEASEADFAAVPALHKTRMDILVLASRACRRYLELEPDDVELRRRTAQVYRYTANVHRLTNAISDAEPLYRDAVRLYAALAEQFPQAPAHQQYVSETLRDQAKLQSNVGRLKEASTTLQRAIALAEKLVNDDPDDANRQRSLAATLLSVAGLQYAQGQFAESGQTAARCATLYRAVLKGASTHPYDRVLLGAALNFQALTEREQGRLDKAIELHKEPTKMLFDLTAKPPQGANRNDVIHFYCAFQTERANSWMQKAEAKWYAVADKALTACIDSWEALAKNYPLVPMYRDSLGTAYQYRGQLRGVFKQDKETPEETTKRLAAARADLAVSQKLLETRVKESPDMPGPHADLGRTYLQQGKLALAMNDPAASATWFTKAAESLTKALELSPDSAASARTLAEVRKAQK